MAALSACPDASACLHSWSPAGLALAPSITWGSGAVWRCTPEEGVFVRYDRRLQWLTLLLTLLVVGAALPVSTQPPGSITAAAFGEFLVDMEQECDERAGRP